MRKAYVQLVKEENKDNMVRAYGDITRHYGDAGLDLFCVEGDGSDGKSSSLLINLGFSMVIADETLSTRIPIPYMLLARSSTHKMGIMQSNNVGIIDAGYRGELMVPVISTNGDSIDIDPWSRLFQAVPFDGKGVDDVVVLLEGQSLEDMFPSNRGVGGFGSTGA